MMIFINAKVLGPEFAFFDGGFTVENEKFAALEPGMTDAEDAVDLQGDYVIPGLIDVHMHGYGGFGCDDKDPENIRKIGQALIKKGVTGYAATIGSAKDERAVPGIRSNQQAAFLEKENRTGSRILGMHMEGPFLNMVKKGGMDADCIVPPTLDRLQLYLDAADGEVPIRIMTIAPEMPGAEEVIRYGVTKGIRFSMGHTNAVKEEAEKALEWGATRATHTFNAMRALNHREIGVLGVSLSDDRVQCEMISDFVHLKKEICLLIYRMKGADKVTVISDSLSLAGMPKELIPEGIGVEVRDALYLPDGTLCGSTGNVMLGIKNLIGAGIPMEDAVKMASLNPARDMGRDGDLGSIAVGKLADFVVLGKDMEVKAVYVGGKKLA